MLLGGEIAYHALKRMPPPQSWLTQLSALPAPAPGKLGAYWGESIWADLAGKTVIDFGCRTGGDSIDMAMRGAGHVIGVDIVEEALAVARRAAEREGVADRCEFRTRSDRRADRIVCVDAFEHFDDPADILEIMAGMLAPDGRVYTTFGPPWLHPRGGHAFSVFPWAHLLFTEAALLHWRSGFRTDGARRFGEVEGGLNQMTLRRFEKLVSRSPLRLASFESVPIRATRWLHCRLTREFLSSMVRCVLVPRA